MNTTIFYIVFAAVMFYAYFTYIHKGLMKTIETAKAISKGKQEMPSIKDAMVELDEAALEGALEIAKDLGIKIQEQDEDE